jgi:hypothetical protein
MPLTSPNTFRITPDDRTLDQRRAAYTAHILKNPAPDNRKAIWAELVRLAGGGTPDPDVITAALDFIDARRDCADFILHGVLRLLFQFAESGAHPLPTSLLARAEKTVLSFKYFPDEPGVDSMCTWTENHYILFTAAAYLAGQRYPEALFTNSGETGLEKMARNRPRILRWIDLRFRTGFSEWLSNVYYDEDLTALLSLYDLAEDEAIRRRAETLIHLIALDMALNSFQGVFGSTHGRSYGPMKQHARQEDTTDTMRLLFGMGAFALDGNMSAAALTLSRYQLPSPILAIAQDQDRVYENRQRMGIRLDELARWELKPDNFEDGMHLLTLEAYLHPRTVANTLRMFDRCGWWENAFFAPFKRYRRLLRALRRLGLLPLLVRFLKRDLTRNTREAVNILTCRTPATMLSTAQDYRKGFGGDQQHIWQATLGPEAVCFTTHPADREEGTPNAWTGSGLLPRAAQYRNLVIVIYRLRRIPALYVPVDRFATHAWLPRDAFDAVVEQDDWVFARKGAGYLALRSMQPTTWQEDGRVLLAAGRRNIWICQLGWAGEDGDFEHFMRAISRAELRFRGLQVMYDSPGHGRVRFGWRGPLRVNRRAVPLKGYPRYQNPYVQAPFDPDHITLRAGGHTLRVEG